ncbi:tRNA (N6-isopentenyl adenosine(37)-C2)-methylthiotransferase MiaB [Cohnella sp. GCM10027633]|uniref:tRNA (N6-isopentenyl adenosine(37)-C2)-methylthiotransferase MiaB n=1 Tax=unclassified Cohnella TaxID=2636738 RepID=UPI00363667E2
MSSEKGNKDYASYFDFSSAKVVRQSDGKTIYRINGRDIAMHSAPSYSEEKKRGKEEIQVLYENGIPDGLAGLGRGKKYLIYTYGCQMNEHDTEIMRGLFEAMGYEATDVRKEADVILLNTCAVRENAEDKVFGELGHLKMLKQQRPEVILGICGCMSQEASVVNRIMHRQPHVDLIFGTHNIHRLPYLLQDAHYGKEMVVEVWSKEGDIIENLPKKRAEGLRAWVNIMYGCDKFCTYCIVPYTRGKERSRLPEDVIAEVRDLARQGYKEITLLGQNVNAYGKDFDDRDYRFGHLMDDIRRIDIPRVRFTTSHPRDFDDHLIEVLAKGGNLVEHIHLPVQSGSTDILKRMSRKYTRERFLDLVGRIREAIPNAVLTSDIIVGFPGETEEQFEETLSIVREANFSSAYTFIYSPREGTPAAEMDDDVPYEVKHARLTRLNELVGELSLANHLELQDRIVEVLVEGESKNNADVLTGRTRTNKLIHFQGQKEWIGQFVHVRVTEPKAWYIKAEVVAGPDTAAVQAG